METSGRDYREVAAQSIFTNGSVKIDLEKGFQLAIHQELPEAPPSPFYLNLRKEGVKGGVLNNEDFAWIGLSLHRLCRAQDLFAYKRPVCSIPAAGDPFLDALLRLQMPEGGNQVPTRFRLIKDESSGKRKFALAEGDDRPHLKSLLVDDLVASMLTKQLAIDAIKEAGGKVTDLVVFVNRSVDAKTKLATQGINLHAVWEFEHLMEWALGRGYLTRKQFEVIMEYPTQLVAFKQSVGYDK